MSYLKEQVQIDSWLKVPWDKYVQIITDPAYTQAKGYYHNDHMRHEMSPVSFDHGLIHIVIILAATVLGSQRIQVSQVSPGLAFSDLDEALRRSRETDQSQIVAWLLTQFQTQEDNDGV